MKKNIVIIGVGLNSTTLAKLVDVGFTVVNENEIPKQEPLEFALKPLPELDWIENVQLKDMPRHKYFDKPRHNYKK